MARTRRNRPTRRLLFDSLESRRVMAADFHFGHNFISPEDTDGSGVVSPIDALLVINAINANTAQSSGLLDVTADDTLSAIDALMVINHLNEQQATSEPLASGVSNSARIARIEATLASGVLPSNLTATEAEALLQTLALGGSPELGDCPSAPVTDTAAALTRLTTQLTDLGVASDTVDKVVSEIQTQLDAGQVDFKTIVASVLADNNIDLKALLAQQQALKQIDDLAARLVDLGIDQTVIDSLTAELTDAVNAGTPYTLDQLVARLAALGIDPTKVFPAHHDASGDDTVSADQLSTRLEQLGVDAVTIATVVSEIQAAEAAGTPWTRADLFARLQELGVVTNTRGGRGRRG